MQLLYYRKTNFNREEIEKENKKMFICPKQLQLLVLAHSTRKLLFLSVIEFNTKWTQ